jgi:hypothetical protein
MTDEDFPILSPYEMARRRRLLIALYVTAALALALFLSWGYLNLKWSRELDRRLRALRAAGQPMQAGEVACGPVPEAQNAAVLYQQVFRVSFTTGIEANTPLIVGMSVDEARAMTAYVATGDPHKQATVTKTLARPEVQEALRIFDQGSQRPYCAFPVNWSDGPHAAMPHLEKFRAAALLIAAQARWLSRHGRREEALHWLAVGLRMARHAGMEPTRLSGLAEYATCTTVLRPAREIVCTGPPPAVPGELGAALRDLKLAEGCVRGLQGEMAMVLQVFQSMGTDRATMRALLGENYSRGVDAGRWARYLGPLSRYWRARDECMFIDFMLKLQQTQSGPAPAASWRVEDLENETLEASQDWRAPVTHILVSFYDDYLSKRDLAQAEVSLCQVALALRTYQAQHGQYPDSLKALPKAPTGPDVRDPFSLKPLLYQRTKSGFVLYSLGPDRRDDEGVPNEDDQGRRLGTGDIVWSCEQ